MLNAKITRVLLFVHLYVFTFDSSSIIEGDFEKNMVMSYTLKIQAKTSHYYLHKFVCIRSKAILFSLSVHKEMHVLFLTV